jgi:predicted porin
MNKKLLTLAIGAALVSAPMFANAAATVYGVGHLSIDMLDNGNPTNSDLLTLSSNSSYLGFKAEEDLGGGTKALFGAELQFALDSATTAMANRNVFVGLSGGFGTVRLGQYDDIVKQIGRKVDFFMSEQIGENRSLTAANSMDARTANSINYESPKLGPVMITANYGFATNTNETTGSDLTSYALGAQLDMGGLYVGAAMKSRDIDVGTTKDQATGYRVTASFTMGAFKVGGLYQNVSDDTPVGTVNDIDLNVYGLGASFKIGNGTIKGQYYVADAGLAAGTDGATLMAIGYDHNLS